jgi:CHASE3 domain sensor protein
MQFQLKVALAFGGAIVTLICLGMLSFQKISDDQTDQRRVVHTHVVLETLNDLLLTVSTESKTEPSQRSSFSSNHEPSSIDKERLRSLVRTLRELTRDNQQQQDALNRMDPIIETAR